MASRKLTDADPRLVDLFQQIRQRWEAAFPGYTLLVFTTYRSPEEQYEQFRIGQSQIDGRTRKGKHNYYPSRALDVVMIRPGGEAVWGPRAEWMGKEQFTAMMWCFGQLAQRYGLRWGNDWNGDGLLVGPDPNESFVDSYHIELMG